MLDIGKQSFIKLVAKSLPKYIDSAVREYIGCQFALESNFGTSPFACNNHNYCGMRVPSLRITTAYNFEEKGKFAKYVSFGSCVADYLLYLQALKYNRSDLSSIKCFRYKLDVSGYCPDLGYLDKIDSLYKAYCDLNFNLN